jgi:hypothetical protein
LPGSPFRVCGPTSLVAAEIHLGHKPAGICDGWLHCSIQVACHLKPDKLSIFVNAVGKFLAKVDRGDAADFKQPA